MLYGSETWTAKENIRRLEKSDLRMIMWMCNASVRDRSSDELKGRLGLIDIREVSCRKRLNCFGHIENMDDENWERNVVELDVSGRRIGWPLKTWGDVVSGDLQRKSLSGDLALDRKVWRAAVTASTG